MNTSPTLGKTAAVGALYLGVSQAVRVTLTLVSTVIVARILTPGDYGVMAMVAPVTAFLLLFQNLGLSQAAIQARELSDQQSSALFWLNMAAAVAVALVLVPAAWLVAWFYNDPRAGQVTAASAATMLVSGCAVQHLALLSRNLDFRRLSLIEIAAALVTFVVTIGAAVLLRTFWALWLGVFFGAASTALLAWIVTGWRPSWKIRFRGSGALIRFGGAITGFNLLNFLNRNLDNILIGRMWGPAPLGLYDRSYKLMMFPLQSLNGPAGRVMLPLLSRLQDDPERFRHSYLMVLRGIMLLAGPPIAVAVATSEQLVPFLLGERWSAAAPIFFWLSLAAFLQPIGNSTGWIFMATGRASAMLRWGAFSSVFLVLGFIIGVQQGPAGVAAAYFITLALLMPFLFAYSARGTPVKTSDFYSVLLPAIISAVLAWASVTLLLDDWPLLPTIALGIPIAYGWALILLWTIPDGRQALRHFASQGVSAVMARRLRRTDD